jgi:HAD superfamily hydrolase (TIGR01509 family)
MIRAVVFDFDGVIANTEPLHFQALRDVLAQQAVALTEAEYYDRYLGYDDVGAFGAIAADRGVQWDPGHVARLVARKAARLEALEGAASVLFPGAAAAIRRMAEECPLGIASGALRAEIVHILNREDLAGFFPVVVAAEDTPTSKPAPDPYLRAVEQMAAATGLALAPSDCVAIEDSRWGLESARSAGLRTVGITHTYPADTLTCAADTVISHLDQLTWELLGKFENVRR